jgi:hypothetical protein
MHDPHMQAEFCDADLQLSCIKTKKSSPLKRLGQVVGLLLDFSYLTNACRLRNNEARRV